MATAVAQLDKPKRGRPKINRKARFGNKNAVGNKGGGRKEWAPAPQMFEDPVTKVLRRQTQEEAWNDARAMVRHMAAVGTPIAIMGHYLIPQIKDQATLRKHFEWELEHGKWQANLQVAGVAFRMATSGRHENMTRWWMERQVPGFQPKVDVNVKEPIPVKMIPGDETI